MFARRSSSDKRDLHGNAVISDGCGANARGVRLQPVFISPASSASVYTLSVLSCK